MPPPNAPSQGLSRRRPARAFGTALALLGAAGCLGYRTYRAAFPPDMQSLAVGVFENDTLYNGVEFELTRALQEELARRRGAPLASIGEARAVVSGRLVAFSPREALTVDRQDAVIDRQVVAAAAVTVTSVDGAVLYENPQIVASATYRPEAGQSEEEARRRAIAELARRIVFGMLDRW